MLLATKFSLLLALINTYQSQSLMSMISFQKLLSIIEAVLKILLRAIDVLQGEDPVEG